MIKFAKKITRFMCFVISCLHARNSERSVLWRNALMKYSTGGVSFENWNGMRKFVKNDINTPNSKVLTSLATCKFKKSGSESISRIGLRKTLARSVLRKVRKGIQAKSSSGSVKYKTVSIIFVKCSAIGKNHCQMHQIREWRISWHTF